MRSTTEKPKKFDWHAMDRWHWFALSAFHCAVLFSVSAWYFSRQAGSLFNGLDGANMLTMVAHQFSWTAPALGFTSNPLQGLSDIWFTFNAWLSPGYLLPYLALADLTVADRGFQVAVYSSHALILFIATIIFARSIKLNWPTAIVAGWTIIIVLFPVFGSPLIYPIVELQPNLALTIAETQLVVACIATLGRGSLIRDVAVTLILLLLAAHSLLVAPTSIILTLPFYGFMALGLILGATSRREVIVKLAGMSAIAVALASSGFIEFLMGIFGYTAANVFANTFANDRMSLYFVSILFQWREHGIGGPLLVACGIAGLIHASIFSERRALWVARLAIAFTGLLYSLGAATVFFNVWHGPSPVYMEAMLWPVYALFATRLVATMSCVAFRRVAGGNVFMSQLNSRRALALHLAAPVAVALVVAVFIRSHPTRSYTFPPTQPAMIKVLQDKAGLSLGRQIAGRVAFFQLQNADKPATWIDLHNADIRRVGKVGNDFHMVGLWHFSIPTLLEYSPTLSPALFQATAHLFKRPLDSPFRSVLVLRRINLSALAVLGIKFLISDSPLNLPLVASGNAATSEILYLYEVPDAIAEGVSPTVLENEHSFEASLERISNPQFDPRTSFIAVAADMAGTEPASLTPANGIDVRLGRGGYHVSAVAAQRSLVVIPTQFSRCLRFQQFGSEAPVKLIRVNAISTGILFERRLNGFLSYFTGPFENANCRNQDSRDFRNASVR